MSWARRLLNTAYVGARARIERGVPFWPPERIEWLQRRRVRAMVRHAYDTVPFYRRAMDERGLAPRDLQTAADLARLPLVDDVALRRNPEQFVSTRYKEGMREVFNTTGAHSHAVKRVYCDRADVLMRLAYSERDRAVLARLAGRGWGQRQLYILPAVSAPLKRRALWDAQLLVPARLAERQYLAHDAPLDDVLKALDAVRPQVVFSLGSYADYFARCLAERGLSVAGPGVWMYGGDMLSPVGRQMLESRAGCRVYSTYQALEAGRLGFQCERCQGFHLNVDLCTVRLIDEAGRTVPAGEPGEVVISNLHNRAMVLLNYRLGDRAVMSGEPCPCGRSLPMLEQLQGRLGEEIRLPDGRRVQGPELEILFAEELRVTLQAQCSQPAPGRLHWRIVPFSTIDREALRRRLLAKARSTLGEGLEMEIEFAKEVARAPHGKSQRIVPPPERE